MKLIVTTLTALGLMASPVLAHDHYRPHHAPRYYTPPVHNHYYAPPRRHDYTAPLLGVIIGGLVLGAVWYDSLNRRCVNEQATDDYGRPLFDVDGRPLLRTICR